MVETVSIIYLMGLEIPRIKGVLYPYCYQHYYQLQLTRDRHSVYHGSSNVHKCGLDIPGGYFVRLIILFVYLNIFMKLFTFH